MAFRCIATGGVVQTEKRNFESNFADMVVVADSRTLSGLLGLVEGARKTTPRSIIFPNGKRGLRQLATITVLRLVAPTVTNPTLLR